MSSSSGALVGLLALLYSPHALAYLDPGSGSYLFQLAAAALLASMFTTRMYWYKVKDWFKSLGAPKVEASKEKDDPPP